MYDPNQISRSIRESVELTGDGPLKTVEQFHDQLDELTQLAHHGYILKVEFRNMGIDVNQSAEQTVLDFKKLHGISDG